MNCHSAIAGLQPDITQQRSVCKASPRRPRLTVEDFTVRRQTNHSINDLGKPFTVQLIWPTAAAVCTLKLPATSRQLLLS